jgi:hypothetical protein
LIQSNPAARNDASLAPTPLQILALGSVGFAWVPLYLLTLFFPPIKALETDARIATNNLHESFQSVTGAGAHFISWFLDVPVASVANYHNTGSSGIQLLALSNHHSVLRRLECPFSLLKGVHAFAYVLR